MKRIVLLVVILSQFILTGQSIADKVEVRGSTITFFDAPCRYPEFGVSFVVDSIRRSTEQDIQVGFISGTLDLDPPPPTERELNLDRAWLQALTATSYLAAYRDVKVGEKLHLVAGDFELTSAKPASKMDASRVTLKRLAITGRRQDAKSGDRSVRYFIPADGSGVLYDTRFVIKRLQDQEKIELLAHKSNVYDNKGAVFEVSVGETFEARSRKYRLADVLKPDMAKGERGGIYLEVIAE